MVHDFFMLANLTELNQRLQEFMRSLGVPGEYFIRLAMAIVAGGLVGLEREVRGRAAGFRTNVLVCFGSALVMVVSTHFATHAWTSPGPGVNINVDPARIAYGVMTGIGFLGAGTIIHNRGSIRGLTTAAAMWCVAAIGLAAGFGLYMLSIGSTMLVVGVLWILDYVEDVIPKMRYRVVTIKRDWCVGCIAATVERFRTAGLKVTDLNYERNGGDLSHVTVHVLVGFSNRKQYYNFERAMQDDTEYELLAAKEQ